MPQNASNILSDEKNFVPLYFENINNKKNKYNDFILQDTFREYNCYCH